MYFSLIFFYEKNYFLQLKTIKFLQLTKAI